MKKRLIHHAICAVVIVLLGGFLTAFMVRSAPGFETDAEQLDPRLTPQSVYALRAERTRQRNPVHLYLQLLGNAAHGDLGESQLYRRPVRQLIGERISTTAELTGMGLLEAWVLGLALPAATLIFRSRAYILLAGSISSLAVCIPAAMLAILFAATQAPASMAVALVVFPKLFVYIRNLCQQSYRMPHVLMARAKGAGMVRVLIFHIWPVTGGQIVALAGVSVSLAIGAAIPVESLMGIPGIGQLAWQAALGRDLPTLVILTILVATATVAANAASDLLNTALGQPR